MKRETAVTTATLVIALARGASAQNAAQTAARRGLLTQAEAADRAGNHAQALEYAERAGAIQMTPSLRMFIAQQQSQLGRFALSLGNAELCAREAERDASVPNRLAVIAACRELRESLAGRIAHIVVRVPEPRPAGLVVTVAGDPLDPALFNVPTVVTPGAIAVEARGPGVSTFRGEVRVVAGASASIDVRITPGEGDVAAGPSGASEPPHRGPEGDGAVRVSGARESTPASAATGSVERGASPLVPVGVATLAVGLVSVGVGAGLYFSTGAAYDRCLQTACPLSEQPRGAETGGVVAFWTGAGVSVLGAVLLVVGIAGRPAAPRERARLQWHVDPRGALGLTVPF